MACRGHAALGVVLALGVAAIGCSDSLAEPKAPTLGVAWDRSRLSMVEVVARGYSAEEMDSAVAYPLMLGLLRSGWAEVAGAASTRDRTVLYVRTPVLVPTFAVVKAAVAAVSLPDGTEVPVFGFAKPDQARTPRLIVELDPRRLEGFGLTLNRITRTLQQLVDARPGDATRELPDQVIGEQAGQPVRIRNVAVLRLEDPTAAIQGCFDWVLEVNGADVREVGSALDHLVAAAREGSGGRNPVGRVPGTIRIVRAEMDRARMAELGVSAAAVRESVADALGREVALRSPRPILVRIPSSSMEELPGRQVATVNGDRVPLPAVARLAEEEAPETVLRTSPTTVTGYLRFDGADPASIQDWARQVGVASPRLLRENELTLGDRALLGWPEISESCSRKPIVP